MNLIKERIEAIDILRGVALLGILIMNISSFAMPSMAYYSPVVYDINPLNHIIYSVTHILADQKFMAIFSMLFGASTILLTISLKKRNKNSFLLFYSRNFWLLIFGWIHSSYLWYVDILFIYAICAFFLYFFKNFAPKKQFIFGCLIYLIPTFSNYAIYEFIIDRLDRAEQDIVVKHWNPSNETLQQELDAYRGSYKKQVQHRAQMWSSSEYNEDNPSGGIGAGIIGLSYLIDLFCRSFGMMLTGMLVFHGAFLIMLLINHFIKN